MFPSVLIGAAVLTIDTANLLAAMFRTGLSEELFVRGIALPAMRDRRREGAAAAGSSLLFGATHPVNAVVLGSAAIHQAILASGLGFVLYLSRRVSGGIAAPIVAHWLIDFSLFSHQIGRGEVPVSDAAFALILVEIVVVIAALMATVALRRNAAVHSAEEAGPDPDARGD